MIKTPPTQAKKILLAVLDWGLGHASRCVPLIKQWQGEGKQVYVVCSGAAHTFLMNECQGVVFLKWEGYDIRYPTSSMIFNMSWQGIRIVEVMFREHKQMKKWVKNLKPDLIVSDGRFGCFHTKVKSIWLAHQLQIQHSFLPFAQVLNWFYHKFIKKYFQEIWVPDYEGKQALSGSLSQSIPGIVHQYLGPLSRYSINIFDANQENFTPKYHYIALLSGPEPQRSYLEAELIVFLKQQKKTCLIVRGIMGDSIFKTINEHLQIVDCLYGDELNKQIKKTVQIICRSGYSTLMDLHYWQKPAILIPTPGQTEQIYLAKYWHEKGWAKQKNQGSF